MNLTIVEPEATGHRMVSYVRHIGREAQRRGWNVHLLTTDLATCHPAFAKLMADLDQPLSVSFMDHIVFPTNDASRVALLRYQWRQWKSFQAGLSRSAVARTSDVVYVNVLDYCDKVIALRGSPFGSRPFVGLALGINHHHAHCGLRGSSRQRSGLNARLFRRLLAVSQFRTLATIDPLLRDYSISTRLRHAKKIIDAPDLAHLGQLIPREMARQTVGLRDDQVGILIYGSLTARKGLYVLLKALLHERASDALVAVVAGSPDRDASEILKGSVAACLRRQGRLLEFPGFQTETQEGTHFGAADIVWLGYCGFSGMSGVALQAAAAGLPVLACREGLIGWLADTQGMGPTVNVEDTASVAITLSRLAIDPEARARYGMRGKKVAEQRSPEQFAAIICDALARAADTPARLRVTG